MHSDWPILGICGHSGSGKTTLVEYLVGRLTRAGLQVTVVKHASHEVSVDRPGKDSDRIYQAGADVLLESPGEAFLRRRTPAGADLAGDLLTLRDRYDVVLVEGHKTSPVAKLWLLGEGESKPPPDADTTLAVLPRGRGRFRQAWQIVQEWLAAQWVRVPLYGCLLIGGASSRMGQPKHLLRAGRQTWLERSARVLATVARQVVLVGRGDVPASLAQLPRLADVPDSVGPLAGMLSAMRWAPAASWVVAACDLPRLSGAALRWLLQARRPGVRAVLPRLGGVPGVEPLLAYYDVRARTLLEEVSASPSARPADIVARRGVCTPTPPPHLVEAWTNVNTPRDLAALTAAPSLATPA